MDEGWRINTEETPKKKKIYKEDEKSPGWSQTDDG